MYFFFFLFFLGFLIEGSHFCFHKIGSLLMNIRTNTSHEISWQPLFSKVVNQFCLDNFRRRLFIEFGIWHKKRQYVCYTFKGIYDIEHKQTFCESYLNYWLHIYAKKVPGFYTPCGGGIFWHKNCSEIHSQVILQYAKPSYWGGNL